MDAIIIYGNLEFVFRQQRPQKLAAELSEHYPVIYINPSTLNRNINKKYKPMPDRYPNLYILDLPYLRFLERNRGLWNNPLSREESEITYFKIISELTLNNVKPALNIVMHPGYCAIAKLSEAPTIYDCMDFINGFNNVHDDIVAGEFELFCDSKATVFTSKWLQDHYSAFTNESLIIRNGYDSLVNNTKNHDVEHAASEHVNRVLKILIEKSTLNLIYVGAIADWFDKALFLKFVSQCSNAPIRIVCVGRDDIGLQHGINELNLHEDKIHFTGELPHNISMRLAALADAGLIPLNDKLKLIQATNPVKVYEYLSLGLKVISNPIPEVQRLASEHITIASGAEQWVDAAKSLASVKRDNLLPSKKRVKDDCLELLSNSSWRDRANEYSNLIRKHIILRNQSINVDAVIPSTGSHQVLISCLKSLCQFDFRSIIIVLNGTSSPRVLSGLDKICSDYPEIDIAIIHHKESIGFSKAVNIGVQKSTSRFNLIVNDDIIFSPWSLLSMFKLIARNIDEASIYNITTTNIDGDAYRPHSYYSLVDFYAESYRRYKVYGNCRLEADRLGMNCTIIPREVFDMTGGIPDVSGLGYGEDDKFFKTVCDMGHKLYYLPGAYAHHIGSLTFDSKSISLKSQLINSNT